MSTIGVRIQPSDSILAWKSEATNPTTGSSLSKTQASTPSEPETVPRGDAKTQTSFMPRQPIYQFDQIILPPHVRNQFAILHSRIVNHSLLYDEWGLNAIDPQGKHVAFNVYGPPGTGKTMCVEAMARDLAKPLIDVSYAEIESKYVGETGKNIVTAFDEARKNGALLFFDEADSILGKRMTNVTQAADHGVNVARAVMLKQLDAFDGIVAFATNLAKNFDNAFVRRILQHIEVPLPDTNGRLLLWQKMITLKVPGRDHVNWQALVEASDGFAGGDIKNAVVNALSAVVTRSADARQVTTEDLLAALANIRHTKQAVGSSSKNIVEEVLHA